MRRRDFLNRVAAAVGVSYMPARSNAPAVSWDEVVVQTITADSRRGEESLVRVYQSMLSRLQEHGAIA